MNSGFRLYDDDDRGLDVTSLPRTDLVNQQMKNYFKPAFLEVAELGGYNLDKCLKQIKGFNPEKQPLAFQHHNSEKRKELPDLNDSRKTRKGKNLAPPTLSLSKTVTSTAEPALTQNLISWCAGLVGLLVMLLWYLCVRYFRKKPDGSVGK